MALEAQRKDKERKEGRSKQRTEEIHDAGGGEGILFIWGGTVSLWGTAGEFAPAIQNVIQRYCVIYDEKKQLVARCRWIVFFNRVDRS